MVNGQVLPWIPDHLSIYLGQPTATDSSVNRQPMMLPAGQYHTSSSSVVCVGVFGVFGVHGRYLWYAMHWCIGTEGGRLSIYRSFSMCIRLLASCICMQQWPVLHHG